MAVSPTQILIIALVVVLLFGASRIADIGKGLGEGIKNFKKGLGDDSPQDKSDAPERKAPQLSADASEPVDLKDQSVAEKARHKGA